MDDPSPDAETATETYDPSVDPARCIGCGLCPDIAPEVFTIPHPAGCATVYDATGWQADDGATLELAARNCPVRAIRRYPDESLVLSSCE